MKTTTTHLFGGALLSSNGAIPKIPIALTIAGSDPTSGAGIQADLNTFAAHNVYGLSVITAITAQNTNGVQAVFPVSLEAIKKQFQALIADIPFKVLKTGMIYEAEAIEFIADFISENNLIAIVDTPFISSSGMPLIEKIAFKIFSEKLLSAAEIITPNIREAEILSDRKITSKNDMENAAAILIDRGANAVLIKGGHLGSEYSSDFLKTKSDSIWLDEPRIGFENPHGTGCTFSAAIAANRALGFNLIESVKISKEYVTDAIWNSISIGNGRKVLSHSSLITQT